MFAELHAESQITLPKEIVDSLGLREGDIFDVFVYDGIICLKPVVIYSKNYVETLQNEVAQLNAEIQSGKQSPFDSVDALMENLEK